MFHLDTYVDQERRFKKASRSAAEGGVKALNPPMKTGKSVLGGVGVGWDDSAAAFFDLFAACALDSAGFGGFLFAPFFGGGAGGVNFLVFLVVRVLWRLSTSLLASPSSYK